MKSRHSAPLGAGSYSRRACVPCTARRSFLDADLRAQRFTPGPLFAWADAPAVVAALRAFRVNELAEAQQ